MIQELRIYRFHEGQKKTFLKEFRKARQFMKKYGVTFVAAWENPDRDDEFIWMRSFADAKAREKAIEAYYSSPEWLKMRKAVMDKGGIKAWGTRKQRFLYKMLKKSGLIWLI